jgi:hypothetical protein
MSHYRIKQTGVGDSAKKKTKKKKALWGERDKALKRNIIFNSSKHETLFYVPIKNHNKSQVP